MRSLAALLAVVLSVPVAAAPVKAPAAAPESADVVKARELFQRAQKLYKDGRYAEAITVFDQAYAVRPHPVIQYNVGKCYEQMGETPKALRAFRDYLRLMPDAKDRDAVAAAIVTLERSLKDKGVQQLMVFAEPPSARVEVDGKDLGASPVSVELPAGDHRLTVRADGYETVSRPFVMSLARAMDMTISLREATQAIPPPPPPPMVDVPRRDETTAASLTPFPGAPGPMLTQPEPAKVQRRSRVWKWVAGGVAVAGAGAATTMGLMANGAADELRSRAHPQAEAQALHDKAQGMALGANVAWGVAAGAAVAAVLLFVTE